MQKKRLLLNTIGVWEKDVIALKGIIATVYTIVKDLVFFLI